MPGRNLISLGGIACILAGVFLALATLIHPSRETARVILEQEGPLIAAHWLYTLFCGFLLLGLPAFYIAQSERLGRLGFISFLMVFFGTLFFAVANDYGFVAPVLAAHAPALLDAVNAYPHVAAMNGLLIVGFFLGLILFGVLTLRVGVFPRQIGLLLAIGSPMYVVAGALGQLVYQPLWTFAILGALAISAGLVWAGYGIWSSTRALVVQPTA